MSAASPEPLAVTRVAGDGSSWSSSSTIVGMVTTRTFHVRVDNYSKTREMRNGAHMLSSSFVVGDQPWKIKYYPNGSNESATGQISIFLVRVGGVDLGLLADVQFDLIAQPAGTAAYALRFKHAFRPDTSYGYASFVSPEKLEELGCLKDDSFTILLDVELEGPPFVVEVPPSSLGWHLGDLLGETEGADVAFVVGGERFPAHRLVLAARSLVFKAQLLGPLKVEKGATISIDDMHADVFRAFLHFIYTDELPDDDDDDNDDSAAAIMAQHLLVAADKYDMPRLRLMCESRMSKRVCVSTAATTLALAEQHGCHGLKEVVLRFLKLPSHMKAVRCTEDYKHLLKSCPSIQQELTSSGLLP
ncbi:BTB/POZ and MATH domain-containing protein 1-like [Oryza brachyantha]|uniref:BTB domain-containing protein n=1 Tax=Oryza brachyantha TaxID=4533 RepID=J3N182_ORYBR|nr:BTB/POZ and MATH domain-containing protein 1-like [Oryza brachyantha]